LSDPASDALQRQLQAMALLSQLQRKARSAQTPEELGFVIVNETRMLLEYRQAALWVNQPSARVRAVSDVAMLDAQAPYIVFLDSLCRQQYDKDDVSKPIWVSATELPEAMRKEWQQWLAPHAIYLPLMAFGKVVGGLLLVREQKWQEAEAVLLAELGDAYGHAWRALQPAEAWWRRLAGRNTLTRWLLGVAVLLMLPLRQSVVAPAEVVAYQPTVIRAPLQAVVDQFYTQPNQSVDPQQVLLTLENTDISNRLEISRKALAVAEAEYRKTAQQAMFDQKSKADMAVLKAQIDQQRAEVDYMQDQMRRSQIKAPHAGVAIFSDVHDWIGRPVALGEKILLLADPERVELEIHLPVADLIELTDGAEAVMFLNVEPQHPLDAKVYSVSYQAELGADNVLFYKVKAHIGEAKPAPRIGLKGTAKLYGQRVTLFYYLFRRPLAALRQWLGV